MTADRIDDRDPTRSEEAIFLCARCTHQNRAPENAPPSICLRCGAHLGKHQVLCGTEEDRDDALKDLRSGEAERLLRRRLAGDGDTY